MIIQVKIESRFYKSKIPLIFSHNNTNIIYLPSMTINVSSQQVTRV